MSTRISFSEGCGTVESEIDFDPCCPTKQKTSIGPVSPIKPIDPLPPAPTDINEIVQLLADYGLCDQPL